MKAIVYQQYGPPDVLQLEEVEAPAPGDNDILIRVYATEVTKSDCELRSFRFPVKWFWLPLRIGFGILRPRKRILGGYFAGVVEMAGKNVTRFRKGEPVFGCAGLRLGAYGEQMRLPADFTIVPKPGNISFEEAAAVPLGGLNALHFLSRANIRKGEKVLINGAGGSIGTFGVQIAKAMGAEVTAVDSGNKEEMLRRIGANHFFDYTRVDITRIGRSWDVIFNMVARSAYSKFIKILNPGGRYLISNPRLSDMLKAVFTSRFTDKKAIFALAGETVTELLTLKDMVEKGTLKAVIDKIYPMSQAVEAHHRVETEQRLGIVVISIGRPGPVPTAPLRI
jgi:NADPH:quinone reductase-like Zn-dependent oxidoreductase